MPILSWSSTANSNFPSETVNIYYSSDESSFTNIISVQGANTVVQLPSQVSFEAIIVRLMEDGSMPLCLDAVFAIKEFYLNPWL